MAESKKTFFPGRMNQDIDARLLPQGEYRQAINLLISRSEGATVGEFENVLGNTLVGDYIAPGIDIEIIGINVDERNNCIYVFATDYNSPDGDKLARASTAANCIIARFDLQNGTPPVTIVQGYWLNFNQRFPINQTNLVDDLLFWTDNFNQPRRINVESALGNPSFYQEESQVSVAQYYPYEALIPLRRQTVTTVATGSDTLITLTAGNDQIRVGDFVTANDKTEITSSPIQNSTPPVRVVEIINPGVNTEFRVAPAIQPGPIPSDVLIDFSRTTMENRSDLYLSNYSFQEVSLISSPTEIKIDNWVMGGFPRIGDRIINLTTPGNIPADLRIKNFDFLLGTATNPVQCNMSRYSLIFDKPDNVDPVTGGALTGFTVGDEIAIAPNDTYDSLFDGDTKFLDDKFVRFSYRFRFVDNEYSLTAPFSQIMFIPKQYGEFGLGQTNTLTDARSNTTPIVGTGACAGINYDGTQIYNYYQDEKDAYTSTILEWFENDIDSIELKIPLPTDVSATKNTIAYKTIENFKINKIDILYKESDSQAIKVLDTIDLSLVGENDIEIIDYNDDINGLISRYYLRYTYTSNKPYKTLPEGQTTRVYDKVPIKAISQELISNRVVYGNFLQGMTPPESIEYTANWTPKDLQTSDYSTEYPYHTIKQNRTYQVGFVLADYYGRQSDVILSTLDQTEDFKGSTVYVPYLSTGDAVDEPVKDWLGRNLTLDISEQIGTTINPAQGKPGLYREQGWIVALDTPVYGCPISGFEENVTYATTTSGVGTGCTIRVTSVTPKITEIDDYIIATAGKGYEVGDTVTIESPTGCTATFDILEIGEANPLGWYTYKVVVKQQEQEYYNVFLPGFVNGLPICDQVWNGVVNNTNVDGAGTPTSVACPSTSPIETQRGKIAFATLLSENVNKVPRNLDEVGPTDLEYNSDEILFVRVNNPNVILNSTVIEGVNKQYYPNQLQQNVITIETVRESEIQAIPFRAFNTGPNLAVWPFVTDTTTNRAVPCDSENALVPGSSQTMTKQGFRGEYGSTVLTATDCLADAGVYKGNVYNVPSGSIPWGDVGPTAPFYGADQNPFIIKIGQVNNFENPIGAIVTDEPLIAQGCCSPPDPNCVPHDSNWVNDIRSMLPILTIAETKPVYSLLDIFWESTLSGKLEVLNSSIASNYNGVIGCSISEINFPEDTPDGTDLTPAFNFINGSGGLATVTSVTITNIFAQSNPAISLVPPSDYFSIQLSGGPPTEWEIATAVGKEFWFRENSLTPGDDIYVLSLEVESVSGGDTFVDNLPNALTISLENVAPAIYEDAGYTTDITGGAWSIISPNPSVVPGDIITLYGLNGSVDASGTPENRKRQLVWTLLNVFGPNSVDGTSAFDSFQLSAGPVDGSIVLSNTTEVIPEVAYGFEIGLCDANGNLANGALCVETTGTVTFGTQPAPLSIGTLPGTWATTQLCPDKYLSTENYPAFAGLASKSGEFRFTRADSLFITQDCLGAGVITAIPGASSSGYFCWNVCEGITEPAPYIQPGFDASGICPVLERGRGDLFQGTLDLFVYFQRVTTNIIGAGNITGKFNIQYRTSNAAAWTNIDSVPVSKAADPSATDSLWSASTSVATISGATTADPACSQIGFRYKFDQIGEYRVVCAISGTHADDWGFYINYADGTYTGATGPCEP